MGLFDRFRKVKKEPRIPEKPAGGHGSHFDISVGDMELVKGLVMYAANEPDTKENLETETPSFGKSTLFVGIKETNKYLSIFSQIVNKQLYTAYPKNLNTLKYPITVKKVTEWENVLEAWIEVQIFESNLNFFALDYYKNKMRYKIDGRLNINLSAFAYRIKKAEERKLKTKEGKEVTTKSMCAILPYSIQNKNAFQDDYWFQGQVIDIISFGKNKLFKTKVAIFGEKSFEIWIYALSNKI